MNNVMLPPNLGDPMDSNRLKTIQVWLEPKYQTLIQQIKSLHPNTILDLGTGNLFLPFRVYEIVDVLEATHAGTLMEDARLSVCQAKLLNLRAE